MARGQPTSESRVDPTMMSAIDRLLEQAADARSKPIAISSPAVFLRPWGGDFVCLEKTPCTLNASVQTCQPFSSKSMMPKHRE